MYGSRNEVRARTPAKKCGAVELSVRKDQRESPLEYSDSVDAPSSIIFSAISLSPEKNFLPCRMEIEDKAHHQTLGNVLRGERTLSPQIVVILDSSDACLQPRSQRVGVADEFRIGVSDQQRPGAREPSLYGELKGVIDAVV